jgi:hypothetical protein
VNCDLIKKRRKAFQFYEEKKSRDPATPPYSNKGRDLKGTVGSLKRKLILKSPNQKKVNQQTWQH